MTDKQHNNLFWRSCLQTAFLLASLATAQAQALEDHLLFSQPHGSDKLVRYGFGDDILETVGTVKLHNGTVLSGIGALAHVPRNTNLFAFWKDPSDHNNKLVYVNCVDASATIVGHDLGWGRITGAVAVKPQQDNELAGNQPTPLNEIRQFQVYAVRTQDDTTVQLSGLINLNPNNSPNHEFILITSNGATHTKDDLKDNFSLGQNGIYYEGGATYVRIKPKANSNSLTVNNEPYDLHNNTTYTITGDDMDIRVYNDHVKANGKAMGHWWIEFNSVTAKIQDIEAEDIPFQITNSQVTPSESYAAKVTVLGAAISYGGQYDLPVTMQIQIDGETTEAFGEFSTAVDGNVNDHQNHRHFILPTVYEANTPISVRAKSWLKKRSSYSGLSNNHWKNYLTIDSSENSPNVITLRDGDAVPDIDPFLDQDSTVAFIQDYIDVNTNTIKLDKNQAIYLFELGTTNLASSAADFQDLVVLVTLAKHPDQLVETLDLPVAQLIQIDPRTCALEPVMALSHAYQTLTANTSNLFYATVDGRLYRIDPQNQTETLLETSDGVYLEKLGATASTIWGFGEFFNNPTLFDFTHNHMQEMPGLLASQELGPIVLVRQPDVPSSLSNFD